MNSPNPYFPPRHASAQPSAAAAGLIARSFATFLVGIALLSGFVGAYGAYSEARGDGLVAADISALVLFLSVAVLWPLAARRFWNYQGSKWRLVLGPVAPTFLTIIVLLATGRG